MHTVDRPTVNIRAWRRDLESDRTLPQSARRFGEWLSRRQVRGSDDLFSGCQDSAAINLGLDETTVRRAIRLLVKAGYIERVTHGTRQTGCARFRLRQDDQSTGHFDRLTAPEKMISQPGVGARLKRPFNRAFCPPL
jgi:hypothetical protein